MRRGAWLMSLSIGMSHSPFTRGKNWSGWSGIVTDGEFSKGNFIFKEIRNLGLLDALKDTLKDIRSKELSVESLLVNNESINYNNSSESRKFIELPSFTYALSQLKLGDDFLQELQNLL